ncbi:MAG: transporter, partial [Deltaproteobacteria bacterium]|nr:transporter [Deltaproteobacteria bacterium]
MRIAILFAALAIGASASAQESNEKLAKQLANPISSLVSMPFQLNYDSDIGPRDQGDRWLMNIQPVIPVSLSQDWNVISRTILPVIHQDD